AGRGTHILIDERAHASLVDAAAMSGLPTLTFRHRDVTAARRAAKLAERRAKLLLFTDGLFSHSGQVAPLADYLSVIPNLAWVLVDDAHGAGILGRCGRGTAEFL